MSDSSQPPVVVRDGVLSNKNYDLLKHLAQYGLPALSGLYFGLGRIWNFPDTQQIVGSIAIVNTFLGIMLHYTSVNYVNNPASYDGMIDVNDSDDKTVFQLNLFGDPSDIPSKKSVSFKVNPPVKKIEKFTSE